MYDILQDILEPLSAAGTHVFPPDLPQEQLLRNVQCRYNDPDRSLKRRLHVPCLLYRLPPLHGMFRNNRQMADESKADPHSLFSVSSRIPQSKPLLFHILHC